MFAGAAFTDAADIETTDAVDTLVALGVIDGYEDGSFQPTATVTRAEMAKMIYTILNGGNDDASAYEDLPTSFTDLTNDWYKGYIKYLQNSGIIAGKSATQFAPDETVTGVEAAKMMLVAAGYSSDKAGLEGSAWVANTMKYANANSLFADVTCNINGELPRQFAAQILYNSLDMENVVYSNDIEGFKPATDVSDDKTIGGKYMDLKTYEGVLTGSGEFTIDNDTAGKDKIAMAVVEKVNGATADSNDQNQTWDYAEDMTALVGQYVKVQTGKNDKVYGVFAISSENTVVTNTFAKVEVTVAPTSSADGKVEIDGTEYKLAATNAFNLEGVTIATLTNIDKVRSGDQITFISNDGDSKFDLAIVNPMTNFGEVLYVGADSITVAGESSSFDKADINYPEDLAEGDYVAVYGDLYTGDTVLVKADKVTGEIEMTKDNDVRIDGTWYTLGDEAATLWSGIVNATIEGTPAAGDEYTLYVINGVVYNAELETAGSTDTAMVIAAPGSMTVNGNYQVKLLFADNSQVVVEADKAYNGSNGANLVGELVTYEKDSEDVYELTKVDGNNLAGGDSYASHASAASFDESKSRVIINSTEYRVSSTATVYIQYEDDGDILYRAMTGADLNKLGDNFTAEAGGAVVIKDGLASVVILKSSTNYLPGAGSDKLYGYVTEIIGTSKDYTELNVWTSNNELLEGVRVRGTAPAQGELISFNLSDDNYLEGVKLQSSLSVVEGAIKDFSMGEYVTFYKTNSGTINDYNLTDDTEFIYLDTNNTAGVSGSKLAAAQKTGNANEYYFNAKYILDGNDIAMIACDITSRRWYEANGTDAGTVDTTLNPATAPSNISLATDSTNSHGLSTVNDISFTSTTYEYTTTASTFADGVTEDLKLTVTDNTSTSKITVSGSAIGNQTKDYDSGDCLTVDSTGDLVFTIVVSENDKADVTYQITVTIS